METKKYAIIVVGGGFAGSAAAIAAARYGKSVLLIEKYNCLGGVACYNLVNPFMPYWTRDPNTGKKVLLSKGLFNEIIKDLHKLGGMRENDTMCFNHEVLKYVLMKKAIESGVQILFQTQVTGVQKNVNRIESLTVASVSGEMKLTADYFIDATGDANVSFLAGCPFELGRETDNLCQPMTLCFRLANVKAVEGKGNIDGKTKAKGNPFSIKKINELYRQYQIEGKIKNPREDVLIFRTVSDSIYHFNTTRVVKLNPTDIYDVSRAEIEAREQIFEIYNFLRDNFEEFKDSVLISSGLQIGVRESRKVIGEYRLVKEDILACKKFEDSIAVCNYDLDIHSPDGTGTSHYYFEQGRYYTIPYRSLIPKNMENLLVAGRCISASHEVQASLRIMPTCCTIGEAAGVAAAQASNQRCKVQDIDTSYLQNELLRNGAKIY